MGWITGIAGIWTLVLGLLILRAYSDTTTLHPNGAGTGALLILWLAGIVLLGVAALIALAVRRR